MIGIYTIRAGAYYGIDTSCVEYEVVLNQQDSRHSEHAVGQIPEGLP